MLAALKTRTLHEQLTIKIGLSKVEVRNAKRKLHISNSWQCSIRIVRTHTSLKRQVYTLIICLGRLGCALSHSYHKLYNKNLEFGLSGTGTLVMEGKIKMIFLIIEIRQRMRHYNIALRVKDEEHQQDFNELL